MIVNWFFPHLHEVKELSSFINLIAVMVLFQFYTFADSSTRPWNRWLLCRKRESYRISLTKDTWWNGWGDLDNFMGLAFWDSLPRCQVGETYSVWPTCCCLMHWRPPFGCSLPASLTGLQELVPWHARPVTLALSWRRYGVGWSQACGSERPKRSAFRTTASMDADPLGLWFWCWNLQSKLKS